MTATKKKPISKTAKKQSKKTVETAPPKKSLKDRITAVRSRIDGLLARRPHRSFRQTRRRDYVRPLRLPGYWALTNEVRKVLWANKRLFLLLALTYAVLTAAFVGFASQDTYVELSESINDANEGVLQGDLGKVGQAGVLLATGMVGAFNQTPTDAQKIFAGIFGLMVWLTTVWLLRAILSGRKPKLRDGLYNGSAPLLSSLLIGFLVVLQLLPVALAAIGFGAAVSTGVLLGGIETMLFWVVAGMLGLLSLYWITSSMVALVVVTLPGMYPLQAVRTAGDLVIGRRVRVLLRFLWICVVSLLVWALVMIPIIIFDSWLKSVWSAIEWLPLVPVALLAMGSVTVVWMASYVYMLYRKIVDDDASPA
jgi:hypothetical protein